MIVAQDLFNKKWISGERLIKNLCKIKSFRIKQTFKELPKIECDTPFKQAVNYNGLCLAAYKATAEVIFDRSITVNIVCCVIKPLILSQEEKQTLKRMMISWFLEAEVFCH